jgi:hypothetical protein
VVVLFEKGTRDGIGEAEILKGGQKRVLSIKKGGARLAWPGAREGVGDTRVFGASVLLAEGGKPETAKRDQNTRLAGT